MFYAFRVEFTAGCEDPPLEVSDANISNSEIFVKLKNRNLTLSKSLFYTVRRSINRIPGNILFEFRSDEPLLPVGASSLSTVTWMESG